MINDAFNLTVDQLFAPKENPELLALMNDFMLRFSKDISESKNSFHISDDHGVNLCEIQDVLSHKINEY
jgi:hypothetical protein